MTRNTVCLSMIVRNEAHVIRRCLRSVRPYIDHWVVSDTGSTDDTIAIVRDELAGIPGELIEREWVDFSTNRNQALARARLLFDDDYLLTIDADEELVMPEGAEFAGMTADAYAPTFMFADPSQDGVWRRHALIKRDAPWEFTGAIHERLNLDGAISCDLPDVTIVSHHDGCRNANQEAKYLADSLVLKAALERDPEDARSQFYLGMCLAGAQLLDEAIEAYLKRVAMGERGAPEEVFYSLYQVAALLDFQEMPWRTVAAAYLTAFNARPTRAEPLWRAAQLHGDNGEFAVAELYARKAASMPIPRDGHMVQRSVYAWRAANDLAGYLAEQGKLAEAKALLVRLAELPQLPEQSRPLVLENIRTLEAA